MGDGEQRRLVQSVDRAFRIVELLADAPRGLSLKETGARMGLAVQTVQGLLRTLEFHGMVVQAGRGRPYELGPAVQHLARCWLSHRDLAVLARRPAAALANELRESVLVVELRGVQLSTLVNATVEQPLNVSAACETFEHLHAMATGKVLLAHLAESERESAIEKLRYDGRTEHTITTISAFRAHLAQVREQGYAESVEEAVPGVTAMAVPLRSEEGVVEAALGVCAPLARWPRERRRSLLAALRRTAGDIEASWHGLPHGEEDRFR
ncbi:MAG: IclR family transcriptional regulator [Lentisphaerae bacterium]|jgi:DNA-binding IclR family transcriptional regulator|nr:IclR family transcriptional regulator [Lentisphaerota bacterium]MBT4817855.1 IclR family transcriptional regulator [Lentisphaerota bacterium]MBT5604622.1 IclR family transcriptional regulator [Lentisphaerota bacterium]MBT7057424.1 IclR family transcriptional regulator [Lentisphaerota bacterium]MBT7845497.1 IclR family transcriptional regulator [Lentisphaerota bacterium]